jgi:hypothetical protein
MIIAIKLRCLDIEKSVKISLRFPMVVVLVGAISDYVCIFLFCGFLNIVKGPFNVGNALFSHLMQYM